jgi:hypothetical protein
LLPRRCDVPKPKDDYFDASDVWVNVGDFDRFGCCDCGMVHALRYRWRNGRLQERWTYDAQETGKRRRKYKVKVTRVSKP